MKQVSQQLLFTAAEAPSSQTLQTKAISIPSSANLLVIQMSASKVSMAATNCTRWRRKTVPVWLIEKGAHAPGLVRLVCCAL